MSSKRRWLQWLLTTLLILALPGCSSVGEEPTPAVSIIATTSVLGDVVANVVGDDASVDVLLPIGADPHDYQASARQVSDLLAADLVVSNGLGLEEGLEDVLEQAAADGVTVLQIGPKVNPLPWDSSTPDEHEEDEHAHEGDFDPHVWLDPLRMADAAAAIAETLDVLSPGGPWGTRAESYRAELLDVNDSIAELLAAVPDEQRVLVTNHDSLGYFAARYDLEVIGTVIPGGTTLANPSSQDLAELVGVMEAAGVNAIFAETTEPRDLAEAVAAELSSPVTVLSLYTGSLGEPGSPAATLVDLLLFNAQTIADALSDPGANR